MVLAMGNPLGLTGSVTNGIVSAGGVVSVVPSGPAAAAGVQAGEMITAVNNTPVHGISELAQLTGS
jgi:S1-C subfamily serine protease